MSECIGFVLDPKIDSIDEVLAIRKRAMALMAEGKSIMKWAGEGN